MTTSEPPVETTDEPPVYVPPPPSGVPGIYLAQPTAIVGDINGSPDGHDDEVFDASPHIYHATFKPHTDMIHRSPFPSKSPSTTNSAPLFA